jgi:hypothetical protein
VEDSVRNLKHWLNVIVVDRLKEQLYLLYSNELLSLNIGYELNKDTLKKMMSIISLIMINNLSV